MLVRMNKKNNYYKFGYNYFGPFLYGYVVWLIEELKKNSFEKVYFFSRDGYMMQQAFEIIKGEEEIASEYIYFSRRSINNALLHYCRNYEESLKYLTWHRFYSLSELLAYYGFDKREREEIAEKNRLELSHNYPYDEIKNQKELQALYQQLKQIIDQKSKRQDHLLYQYLMQCGWKERCAIVDIGWHGSMQYGLEQFIQCHELEINLHGFYVGVSPKKKLKGKVNGFLYEPEQLQRRKNLLCFFGGYEKLFQSCEGSTVSYDQKGEKIIPVLMPYEYREQELVQCIKEMQKAALDYVQTEKYVQENAVQQYAEPLIQFGMNPPLWGVKLFSFFYNTDGERIYFVSQKPIWKYTPRELMIELSNSPWKTGFMKSLFRIPFPYYRVYSLLRK